MEEFHVYEGILEGLREALAYQSGDRSHCRVSVREVFTPQKETVDQKRKIGRGKQQ